LEVGERVRELYPWLVLAALLCLCARWLLDERCVRKVAVAASLLAAIYAQAGVEEGYAQAMGLLDEGRYSESAVAWEQLSKVPELRPEVRQAIVLNLGVAYHRSGQRLAERRPQKALGEFAEAERCYRECLVDETQRERAARNLARLAVDRKALVPPEEPQAEKETSEDSPDSAQSEDEAQPKPGEGAESSSGEANAEASGAPQEAAEKDLTPEQKVEALEVMRANEGDFSEALLKRQARSWRTGPPKKPW
jgi:hypothetical protein